MIWSSLSIKGCVCVSYCEWVTTSIVIISSLQWTSHCTTALAIISKKHNTFNKEYISNHYGTFKFLRSHVEDWHLKSILSPILHQWFLSRVLCLSWPSDLIFWILKIIDNECLRFSTNKLSSPGWRMSPASPQSWPGSRVSSCDPSGGHGTSPRTFPCWNQAKRDATEAKSVS